MPDYFRYNLQYAIYQRFGPGFKDKQLAEALGLDRSTVNRLRHAALPPKADRLLSLSKFFDMPATLWETPPEVFAAEFENRRTPGRSSDVEVQRTVSMHAIAAHRYLWEECYRIHRGQYVAYWKAHGIDGSYVGSLVDVTSIEPRGIKFSMINPYIREDTDSDKVHFWQYEGVMYPVSDYLYFFGEQATNSYELFTMILTASPLAPPDILRGCLSGIHVKDGRRQIAINIALVFLFLRTPISDWKTEVGVRLGKLAAGKVPERIKRLIDPYPGVIPLA